VNRVERLSAILTLLQGKRVIKADEIAERFNISIRTVYRDIRAIEASGVPVCGEAGVGYYLDRDYTLPPIRLSSDEALAMLIAGKLIHDLPDKATKNTYQSALAKIRAILPSIDKDKLERWEAMIQVLPQQRAPEVAERPDNMFVIQQALLYGRVVAIKYFSFYRQQLTNRTIEPIGLLYYSNQWHVIAWCQLRQSYRDFRLDRIQSVELLSEHILGHGRQNLRDYLKGLREAQQLQNVLVQFDLQAVPFISEYRYSMGYVSEQQIDVSWVEMTFLTSDLDYFARWILMFTDAVKVVSPIELTEKIKQLLDELRLNYQNLLT